MDETILVEGIPYIGDIVRCAKIGYKIGSILDSSVSTDNLLTDMMEQINHASKAKTVENCIYYLNSFAELSQRYKGTQKYQNVIFHYLSAKAYHLLALCKWNEYAEDYDELKTIEELFNEACTATIKCITIKCSFLSSNKNIINEIINLAKTENVRINDSKDRWQDYCRKLRFESGTCWIDFRTFIRNSKEVFDCDDIKMTLFGWIGILVLASLMAAFVISDTGKPHAIVLPILALIIGLVIVIKKLPVLNTIRRKAIEKKPMILRIILQIIKLSKIKEGKVGYAFGQVIGIVKY